jgi:hypothetical protein
VRARQLEMKAFLREFKDAFDDDERLDALWKSVQNGSRQLSAACEARRGHGLSQCIRSTVSELEAEVVFPFTNSLDLHSSTPVEKHDKQHYRRFHNSVTVTLMLGVITS